MQLETVVGDALAPYIPDLARLRMTVFRDYPYLYDGSEAYEAEYLRTYTAAGQAIAVLARDGDAIVGASTGVPLAAETETLVRPFAALGLDPATVFYCGESVLLPAWRGRGIYRAFFAAREAYARELGGIAWMSFCGVVRPENHPLRPCTGYRLMRSGGTSATHRRRNSAPASGGKTSISPPAPNTRCSSGLSRWVDTLAPSTGLASGGTLPRLRSPRGEHPHEQLLQNQRGIGAGGHDGGGGFGTGDGRSGQFLRLETFRFLGGQVKPVGVEGAVLFRGRIS